MNEKWIGEKVNTSGAYYETGCEGLILRGDKENSEKLYKFTDMSERSFYINENEVILNIEQLIEEREIDKLNEYIYKLIFNRFGVLEFIKGLKNKIEKEKEEKYKDGKRSNQLEIQKVLGINRW